MESILWIISQHFITKLEIEALVGLPKDTQKNSPTHTTSQSPFLKSIFPVQVRAATRRYHQPELETEHAKLFGPKRFNVLGQTNTTATKLETPNSNSFTVRHVIHSLNQTNLIATKAQTANSKTPLTVRHVIYSLSQTNVIATIAQTANSKQQNSSHDPPRELTPS